MSAIQRVTKLRSLLQKHSLNAYIIPTADAHQSEYVATSEMRRSFISDFTGSAGTAVVSGEKALLWTDGRYFLQADKELDASCWELMKQGVDGVPTIPEWLAKNIPSGGVVGFNPFLMSLTQFKSYEAALTENGISLVGISEDLVDAVWAAEKPASPKGAIRAQPVSLSGASTAEKLTALRAKMVEKKALAVVLCALDEIAWVFNLRGEDISYNPVFFSYALVTPDEAILYVDKEKFASGVADTLEGVTVRPYDAILADLAAPEFVQRAAANKASGAAFRVWMDPGKSNVAVYEAAKACGADSILDSATPVTLAKAIKNAVEIEGMKKAHVRDGVALSRFLAWFEAQFPSLPDSKVDPTGAGSPWTEFSVAEKLEGFRKEQPEFVSLSFDTISSVGPNGAVIHYKPEEHDCAKVTSGQIYLLDSGAQFRDGTTDVTRTFYIPSASAPAPSAFQREAFTRVLMGHASLAAARFPPNTMGPSLDVLARQWLWAVGLNYMHGTGHGVGSFLNVHEGPQGIAMMNRGGSIITTPISHGMVLSNEPGYYHAGEFGIRIENLVHVVDKPTKFGAAYLGFEDLTCVPLDRALIDVALLLPEHVEYVNKYHAWCRETLLAQLAQDDKLTRDWVMRNTEPLSK